jgi:phage/plasmid-like protein (TIGR03299 family)
MSANLATIGGQVAFVSLRENAWHRQGTVIPKPVPGREMLQIAHLAWDVDSAPLFANLKLDKGIGPIGWDKEADKEVIGMQKHPAAQHPVPGSVAIYRTSDGAILGTPSETYQIFQNSEMVDIIDAIGGGGVMEYETAGALGNGSVVWIMARIPDLSYSIKGDQMTQYLLAKTSHDGSSALILCPTLIRVVCQNTMRAAMHARKGVVAKEGDNNVAAGFSIKHTVNMKDMVAKATDALKATVDLNRFSRELHTALAEVPATPPMVEEVFNFVANGGKAATDGKAISDKAKVQRDNKRQQLRLLMSSPSNQTPATMGTAFGLMQTVGEYVDHFAPTRKTDGRTEEAARFEGANFGLGADLKEEATDLIVELAGV